MLQPETFEADVRNLINHPQKLAELYSNDRTRLDSGRLIEKRDFDSYLSGMVFTPEVVTRIVFKDLLLAAYPIRSKIIAPERIEEIDEVINYLVHKFTPDEIQEVITPKPIPSQPVISIDIDTRISEARDKLKSGKNRIYWTGQLQKLLAEKRESIPTDPDKAESGFVSLKTVTAQRLHNAVEKKAPKTAKKDRGMEDLGSIYYREAKKALEGNI